MNDSFTPEPPRDGASSREADDPALRALIPSLHGQIGAYGNRAGGSASRCPSPIRRPTSTATSHLRRVPRTPAQADGRSEEPQASFAFAKSPRGRRCSATRAGRPSPPGSGRAPTGWADPLSRVHNVRGYDTELAHPGRSSSTPIDDTDWPWQTPHRESPPTSASTRRRAIRPFGSSFGLKIVISRPRATGLATAARRTRLNSSQLKPSGRR